MTYRLMLYVTTNIGRTFGIRQIKMAFAKCSMGGRRTIASHNVHETVGKYQEGGMAMMSYDNLLQQFDPEGSGRNDLSLGRWTYMWFVGDDRIVTQIICGYSPCANKKKDSGTVYQQHCRHWINKLKDDSCPRARFRDDLLHQMKQWQTDGK
jgi:hypothetical protein